MSKAPKQPKWLNLFERFIEPLRIDSKEVEGEADGRGAKLSLWMSQRRFLEEIAEGLEQDQRTFICLKSRQLGISTVSLAVDLFWLAMHPGMMGALVADNDSNAAYFRATLTRYIGSFPKNFFGSDFQCVTNNRNFLKFSNGSRLDFLVAGKSKKAWSESRGYTLAHATEVSKYGTIEGLASFRESLAEQHPNRLFIYESTAAGYNHWRDMWISAGNDPYTQRRFFIGWWAKEINQIGKKDKRWSVYGTGQLDQRELELCKLVREKHNHRITDEQLAWYRWRQSEEAADPNLLDQNQPWIAEQAFIQTGYSFFQPRYIQQEMQRVYDSDDGLFKGYKIWIGNDFWATKLEQIGDQDRMHEVELRIWQDPIKEARYVIGCDPAYGRNDWKDRHGITVCRCYADKLVQVAEYADHNIETRQAAWVLAYLAGAYRNCVVNLELGGPGRAVLTEFDYLRLQVRAEIYNQRAEEKGWQDFLANARWYLYHKPDSPGAGYVYAWQTHSQSKFEIMNQLRDSFMTKTLIVNSIPALEEMASVIQDGAEIAAPGRNKDDRVFALALCNRAWIDHVRAGMLTEGLTYERLVAEENGERARGAVVVDRIVYDWFRRQEEMATNPEVPEWMRERGLA